jgi:hypothetical protein
MIYFIIIILCILLILNVIGFIKNEVTYENRKIIREAIASYNERVAFLMSIEYLEKDCRNYLPYSCMESYWRTLFRWYDWSYKNIVPPDVLIKLDSYIEK